jgi:ribosomal protein S18 acetylase RimI-like enzyme
MPIVRAATASDQSAVVQTIVFAFAADPIARWCWPQLQQYLAIMPPFTAAFGGAAFAHTSAHCTEDYGGAALWLPPDVQSDEATMVGLVQQSIPESRHGEVFGLLEQMGVYHPKEPHWYLPLIGVDPALQGKGHGTALLAHALQQCDRDRRPAYLESTNPRNIPLYERHGFKVIGQIQAGTSPPLVPMLRAAR